MVSVVTLIFLMAQHDVETLVQDLAHLPDDFTAEMFIDRPAIKELLILDAGAVSALTEMFQNGPDWKSRFSAGFVLAKMEHTEIPKREFERSRDPRWRCMTRMLAGRHEAIYCGDDTLEEYKRNAPGFPVLKILEQAYFSPIAMSEKEIVRRLDNIERVVKTEYVRVYRLITSIGFPSVVRAATWFDETDDPRARCSIALGLVNVLQRHHFHELRAKHPLPIPPDALATFRSLAKNLVQDPNQSIRRDGLLLMYQLARKHPVPYRDAIKRLISKWDDAGDLERANGVLKKIERDIDCREEDEQLALRLLMQDDAAFEKDGRIPLWAAVRGYNHFHHHYILNEIIRSHPKDYVRRRAAEVLEQSRSDKTPN